MLVQIGKDEVINSAGIKVRRTKEGTFIHADGRKVAELMEHKFQSEEALNQFTKYLEEKSRKQGFIDLEDYRRRNIIRFLPELTGRRDTSC